jgi:hypothetical protein
VPLSASDDDDKVAWYENMGAGIFALQAVISTATASLTAVYVADFDGDNDFDIINSGHVGYQNFDLSLFRNLTNVNCDVSGTPENLLSTIGVSDISLSWDPVRASVACQINANRITPLVFPFSASLFGDELSGTSFIFAAVGPGTSWSWRVRCACELSPLSVTEFSEEDIFVVPALREANFEAQITPNPASLFATISWQGELSQMTVTDLMGKVIYEQFELGGNTHLIDLTVWVAGIYFVTMNTANGDYAEHLVVK